MEKMNPKKIYIIGPESSGKSTLAKILSKKLKIRHYDLDDVVWSRRYDRKRSHERRLKKLKAIIKKKSWIIEGIFGGWTEPVFKKAELIIMLNLNYSLLVKNLLKTLLFGRFKGYEKDKTSLKNTWKLIKHVRKYRTREHVKSYKGHMELIEKYKKKFIEIKTKKDMKKFLREI